MEWSEMPDLDECVEVAAIMVGLSLDADLVGLMIRDEDGEQRQYLLNIEGVLALERVLHEVVESAVVRKATGE